MQLIIKSRGGELSDKVRNYAERKVARIERFFDQIVKLELEFLSEKNPRIAEGQVVEATAFAKGSVIRARESAADTMSAVDLVVDKLEKQVKKYKDKHSTRTSKRGEGLRDLNANTAEQEAANIRIVKTKRFTLNPMTPEEAAFHLDLLAHDFFVFNNAETGEVNVIYRRDDRDFGLIEPHANDEQ